MATAQTSIAIDKSTRDRAAKRARSEQIPLSIVVRLLLTDYADGRINIGSRMLDDVVVEEIEVGPSLQKKMDAAMETWRDTMAA